MPYPKQPPENLYSVKKLIPFTPADWKRAETLWKASGHASFAGFVRSCIGLDIVDPERSSALPEAPAVVPEPVSEPPEPPPDKPMIVMVHSED